MQHVNHLLNEYYDDELSPARRRQVEAHLDACAACRTELDQMRAFCIAMAAAITVIIASQLGLPVSSTHIAVGGVFGVGFLREYIKANYSQTIHEIEHHHVGTDRRGVEAFMAEFEKGSIEEKRSMLQQLKAHTASAELSKKERKILRSAYRKELVKRSALLKIAAAWIITVPAAGIMSALLFFMIRGMMIPREIMP